MRFRFAVALSFVLAATLLLPSDARPKQAQQVIRAATSGVVVDATYLREEQKLARDVYRSLYRRWSLPIFEHIAGAEQRHIERIKLVLDHYRAPDPVKSDAVGVFRNAKLATLYRQLVARGQRSLIAALHVGATVEDLDIYEIEKMQAHLPGDSPQGLRQAYAQLKCGSRNHLRAFTRQLQVRGYTYLPQRLSTAAYAAIIGGDHERCGCGAGSCRGGAVGGSGCRWGGGRRGAP